MPDENGTRDMDDRMLNRMLQDFLAEAREQLDQLNLNLIQLEEYPEDEKLLDHIFRTAHTLKGSAAFAGLKEVSEIAKKLEEIFGDVRRGAFNITPAIIGVMYESLDVLDSLINRVADSGNPDVDATGILEKLDRVPGPALQEPEVKTIKKTTELSESQELLEIYKNSYDQLSALKHLVYSSVHLSDLESLARLFSKQIQDTMTPERNAVWLVEGNNQVVEIARDGKLVDKDDRRSLEISASEMVTRVIFEQLVVWTSSLPKVKELFPEFESPIIFPIKAQDQAFGFIILDPEESAEVELYQFVSQFAALILNISKLHQKVEAQKKELDEMTEILFKQNAQLSSIYHVELELMTVTEPEDLCRIIVESTVNDLEADTAAAFLLDASAQELIGAAQSGGLEGIEALRLPVDKEKPIMQSLETGRIITSRGFNESLPVGSNLLENWMVLGLKGREHTYGVLIVGGDDEDISDPVSILANYSGILLDNIKLQKKFGKQGSLTI